MITKTVEQVSQLVLRFNEEELALLGIKCGDKFEIKIVNNNELLLVPYKTVEINLDEFSKEELIHLIKLSTEKNAPISKIIEEILRDLVKQFKLENEVY